MILCASATSGLNRHPDGSWTCHPLTDKHMHISLVIPAFNEESRITGTLEKADAFFSRQPYDAEIIVVDDGSTDKTGAQVEAFQKKASTPLILEVLPENRGKGAAVRQGMLHKAKGDFRFFYDADSATPVEELLRCDDLFEGRAEVLIGSRALPESKIHKRQAWYRMTMGRCFNRIVRLLGLTAYADTQCGFKGFTKEAAQICFSRQTIDGFGFDAELLYIAARHGLRISELPVNWYNSPQSKVNPMSDAARMFLDLFVILKNSRTGRYD